MTARPPQGAPAVIDDAAGWVAVPALLDVAAAAGLARACDAALAGLRGDRRAGDKPAAGTRRLVALAERVPAVAALAKDPRLLAPVRALLGDRVTLAEATYRSPQPGFGGQRLHADDLPRDDAGPARRATAIVALTAFTATNGATRVVPGSHRRPDLQRRSGSLEHHPGEVALTGPAGTAFVFSGHLLHAGGTNRSDAPRPALQLVWDRGPATS